MATVWGGAQSYNGVSHQLGIDLAVSGVTVNAGYVIWANGFSNQSGSIYYLTKTGAITGTVSGNYSIPSGGGSYWFPGSSITGSRGSNYSCGASLSMFWGGTLTVSSSITVPALAPSQPVTPTLKATGSSTATGTLASAPANNGSAITNYRWEVEGVGQFSSGTSRTANFTGLTAGTSYRVRVYATNGAGSSAWSAWSSAITTDVLAPDAPTDFTATRVSDASTALAWTNKSTTQRPYSSLVVQRSVWDPVALADGAWVDVATLAASATGYTATSQTFGLVYSYRVVATNSAGTASSASSSVRAGLLAPSSLVASKATNNVDIDLVGVAREDGHSLGAFTYAWQDNPGGTGWVSLSGNTAIPSRTITAPRASKTHQYRVQAQATSGGASPVVLYSAWVESGVVQLQAPPLAPTLTAPATNTPWDRTKAILFKWTHNPVDASNQTAAKLRYRTASDAAWQERSINGATAQYPLGAFGTSSAGFEWQVCTKGAHADYGPWSASNVLKVGAVPTVTVTGPAATIDSPVITAVWTAAVVDTQTFTGFLVELLDSAGKVVETKNVAGGVRQVTFTTQALNNLSYSVRVTATSSYGLTSVPVTRAFAVSYPLPFLVEATPTWNRCGQGVDAGTGGGSNLLSFQQLPRNYAPEIKPSGTRVEVARNLSVKARGTVSWNQSSGAAHSIVAGSPIPAEYPHPLGITTANKSTTLVENYQVVSTYNSDGLGTTGPARHAGFWVLVFEEDCVGRVGRDAQVPLTPGVWTFVQTTTPLAAGDRFGAYVNKLSAQAPVGTVAYITGSIASTTPLTHGYFDGDYSPDPDFLTSWTGAAGTSDSVLTGETVSGLSSFGNARGFTLWSGREGFPVRVTSAGPDTAAPGFSYLATPAGVPLTTVTAKSLVDAEVQSLVRVKRGDPAFDSSRGAGSDAGVFQHSVYNKSVVSSANVEHWSDNYQDTWWSELGLYAGDYVGPFVPAGPRSDVVAVDIQRRWDDGPWETLVAGLSPSTAWSDPAPPVSGTVCYRAVSWTSLGTMAYGPETCQVFERATDACPDWAGATDVLQHAWLNFGDDYSESVVAYLELVASEPEVGLGSRSLHRFAGRTWPVEYRGTGLVDRVDLSFVAAEASVCEPCLSSYEDWKRAVLSNSDKLYRDYLSRCFPVSLSGFSFSSLGRGYWQVKGTLERRDGLGG